MRSKSRAEFAQKQLWNAPRRANPTKQRRVRQVEGVETLEIVFMYEVIEGVDPLSNPAWRFTAHFVASLQYAASQPRALDLSPENPPSRAHLGWLQGKR